jgi:hypothetical protein
LFLKKKFFFRGSIYAANDTQAWKLDTQNKFRENLKFLNSNGQHEIAIQIAVIFFLIKLYFK